MGWVPGWEIDPADVGWDTGGSRYFSINKDFVDWVQQNRPDLYNAAVNLIDKAGAVQERSNGPASWYNIDFASPAAKGAFSDIYRAATQAYTAAAFGTTPEALYGPGAGQIGSSRGGYYGGGGGYYGGGGGGMYVATSGGQSLSGNVNFSGLYPPILQQLADFQLRLMSSPEFQDVFNTILGGGVNSKTLSAFNDVNNKLIESWKDLTRPVFQTNILGAIEGLANRGVLDSSVAKGLLGSISSEYMTQLSNYATQLLRDAYEKAYSQPFSAVKALIPFMSLAQVSGGEARAVRHRILTTPLHL